MSSATINVRRLDRCGALIEGIDVTRSCDNEIDAIRDAVFQRGVVFIHGRVLEPEQLIGFARRLAPIVINRYFPKSERYPEIAKVEKSETQKTNIGGGWHTDHSYDAAPAMGDRS
jgi:taurine dioxygenase